MAKELSTQLANQIAQKTGNEPINVVEVDWSDDTLNAFYTDRAWLKSGKAEKVITGAEERVMEIQGIDFGVNINGGGSSVEATLKLSDHDGALKDIIDNHDVHKRVVKIYQTFLGLDSSEQKFLIHRGEISSPIIWDEGERTLTFSSVSITETEEVGFSPEEGQFEHVPEHLTGKGWPLCYGSVMRVPTQKFIARQRSRSLSWYNMISESEISKIRDAARQWGIEQGEGIIDNTIDYTEAYEKAYSILGTVKANKPELQDQLDEYFDVNTAIGWFIGASPFIVTTFGISVDATQEEKDSFNEALAPKWKGETFNYYSNRKNVLEKEFSTIAISEIVVEEGDKFPQNTELDILINQARFRGEFDGNVFKISESSLPRYTNLHAAPRQGDSPSAMWLEENVNISGMWALLSDEDNTVRIIQIREQQGQRVSFHPADMDAFVLTVLLYNEIAYQYAEIDFNHIEPPDKLLEVSPFILPHWKDRIDDEEKRRLELFNEPLQGRTYSIRIGDEIFIDTGDTEEEYVCNIIPSKEIKEVYAFRQTDEGRKLVPIPSRYYTKNLNRPLDIEFDDDGNSTKTLNLTTIKFERPITQFADEAWEDDIYVSLVSSEGPNTADVIEHIIDTWTDLGKDTSTFNTVKNQVSKYPSHFYIKDKRNALDFVKQIAWQSRIAAFEINGKIHLKYLATEETEAKTLTTSDIAKESFKLDFGTTEDLITRLTATWRKDNSPRGNENRVVLRNNVQKYGLFEENKNFFIYNIEELVIKSATFWLIRRSNTWKKVRFKLFLNHLDLELFDTVKFDLPNNLIGTATASLDVKGVIKSIMYDSQSHMLELEVETNVRAGELEPYIFYWPASAPSDEEYPTDRDNFAGG